MCQLQHKRAHARVYLTRGSLSGAMMVVKAYWKCSSVRHISFTSQHVQGQSSGSPNSQVPLYWRPHSPCYPHKYGLFRFEDIRPREHELERELRADDSRSRRLVFWEGLENRRQPLGAQARCCFRCSCHRRSEDAAQAPQPPYVAMPLGYLGQ